MPISSNEHDARTICFYGLYYSNGVYTNFEGDFTYADRYPLRFI